MLLRENSLMIGLAIGVTVPILGYVFLDSVLGVVEGLGVTGRDGTPIAFRERSLMIMALCTNLLPFWIYNRFRADATMRGVFIATAIYGAIWAVTFAGQIFGEL